MSIAVFGGNGFLGRKICEYGIKNGYKVTSFSSSGNPPALNEYLKKVNWKKADLFNEASYKTKLSGYQIVFHSVGKILEDASYKKNLSLKNIGMSTFLGASSNPMKKTVENSFDAVNKDSALNLATNFSKANKDGKFVYISADMGLPIISPDYIRTKREAEAELLKSKANTLIIRPGIMYDEKEFDNRYRLVTTLKKIYEVKNAVIGDLKNPYFQDPIRPILSSDETCKGIFSNLHRDNTIVTLEDLMKR